MPHRSLMQLPSAAPRLHVGLRMHGRIGMRCHRRDMHPLIISSLRDAHAGASFRDGLRLIRI